MDKLGIPKMRYAAVVNATAGTASRLGTKALTSVLNDRLQHELISLRYADGSGVRLACEEAIRDKPDALIIVGGDGTCRTAASVAAQQNVPIVLLPGGTMNVLPNRIWGAEPLERVLEMLARHQIETGRLDMGVANDQPFFVGAMFGVMPALARAREKFRGANAREAMAAVAELVRAGSHLLNTSIRMTAEELGTPRSTAALIVTVGDADQLLPWRKPDDDFAAFECVALNVESWRDAARIALKTLRHGDWRADAKIDNFLTRKLRVEGGRSSWITLDGEPVKLRGPIDVVYKKNALTVIAPKQVPVANDNADRPPVGSSLPG